MATPTPNQRPSNAPGPSATSWSRYGEPGSAFSGLSRGGRGRGSGRGRSGRSGRGGLRETKVIGADSSSDKPNLTSTSKPAPTPSTKPVAFPPPAATEKTPAVPNASPSARPRRNLRRTSRSAPATAVVPPVGTDAPSNPGSSKPASRRRRSQTGKTTSTPAKINVISHDDNHLRPQRPRMGSTPHIAPMKDAPPHLTSSSIDKRTNVNVVLERVGVVNVEDRPYTPGSHIDWAGDDDDSLPDLDDWGFTSAKVATNENGLISPLGVSDLRPLPDMVLNTETSSPHQKTLELRNGASSNQIEITLHRVKSRDDGISTSDDTHVAAPITTTQEPLVSAPASAKVSLCPSLPPDVAGVIDQDDVVSKETEVTAPAAEVEQGLAASIHSPNAGTDEEDPFSNLLARNGLAASIHAPHPAEMTETKSVPSDLSTYLRAPPENRSHIIGRPPSYPRADNNSRPSRSGYNTPRGGPSAYHTRTHSTPPAGSHTRRSPAHRPVLTGDALSRLAKTIGSTTPSPARVPAISAAQE